MSVKNRTITFLIIFGTILLAFMAGEWIASRYALINEMQMQIGVLAHNGPILSECKATGCDAVREQLLISENDLAMRRYRLLERLWQEPGARFTYSAIWPIIFSMYTDTRNIMQVNDHVLEVYRRLGCGLNGVICNPKTGPSIRPKRKKPAAAGRSGAVQNH